MKKNLWVSVPLSLICLTAAAATPATSSTITPAAAQSAQPAPSSTITAAAAQSAAQAPNTATMKAAPAQTLSPTASAMKAPVAPKKAAATSTTKAAAKPEEKATTSFGLIFDTNYTLQASKQPDGSRSQGQDFSLIPSIAYGNYSSDVTFTYAQDLVDSAKSAGFLDPALGFRRKSWELNKYFKLGPSLSLVLPMTDKSKNNVGLMYNVGGALSLSLNTKTLGWDSWGISTSVAYNRNFTNYDTKLDGSPNTMYRIRQRYNVSYSFTDKLSLATRFQFDSNSSVSGIVRNSFLHFQSLGYDINDVVNVNFTHTNSNSMFKDVTYENNLKFYDTESSEYSVGMTVSI